MDTNTNTTDTMEQLFSGLDTIKKHNIICKYLRLLRDQEQGVELCRSVKGYIDSILSDKTDDNDLYDNNHNIITKVQSLFAIEHNSIDQWAMDIARNRFDSYYYFDKSPFLQVLDCEVVNMNGMIDIIMECVTDLRDSYYSVLSGLRNDEQMEELDELLIHIRDLIRDTQEKDTCGCVL